MACSLVWAVPALGQTQTNSETVIVTATRTSQPLNKVGSSVTIITAEQIQQRQALVVSDLLRDVPGVSVNRNGGLGSTTSVRVRGAETDQTVLLIDGLKLNDPASPGGGFDFGNLIVGDIARIDVLRGPQSTLYGSQAIGGVINIITQTPNSPLEGRVDIETGDQASHRARASVRGRMSRLSYAGGLGYVTTDGVSAAASGVERDGFTNKSAQGRVNFAVLPVLDLEARAWWSNSTVGIDGFPPPTYSFADTKETSETDQRILYAAAHLTLLDGRSRTRFGVSETTTDRVLSDPTQFVRDTFLALGKNQQVDIQSTLDIGPNLQLVAGGEFEASRLRVASPSSFDPTPTPLRAKTSVSGLYLQGQASPTTWLTATLGARWTSNDRFGDALNLRATAAARFNGGNTTVRAALANGFKAPTLYQIFSEYGNATLVPEEASSSEIGLEQAFMSRKLVASVTAFKRDTINQIDFASCFRQATAICRNRPFGVYDNIAATQAEGLEVTLEAQPLEGLTLSLAHTQLETRNLSRGTSNFGKDLARRPKTTTAFNVAYVFGFGLDLSATYTRIGNSFNNAANNVRLEGYDLVSVRASQKLSENWSLYLRVDNAGDEIYQTTAGYGSPRRQSFVGLRGTF